MRWIASVLLLLAACGADGPTLELIREGRGPKRALRYSVTPGTTHEVVMTMRMSAGVNQGPPVKITMEINVTRVSAEGDITYAFRFTDVEMDGEMPPGMDSLMQMSGTATVDSRGVTRRGTVYLPDNAPSSMRKMMEKFQESIKQFSCPFPEEPIGVGAKWRLTMPIVTEMFGFEQEAVFELVELDGNRGRLKVQLTQSAEDVEMKLPNGMTATLISLKSKGSGEIGFDLSKPIPEDSYIEMDSDFRIEIRGQTITQSMHISMSFAEK